MKVYNLTFRKRGRSPDLGCDISLPQVQCPECGRTWGLGVLEYPALKFPFFDEPVFSDKRVVSVDEFKRIERRIQIAANRPVTIVPGSSVGEMTGTSPTSRLSDFTWGTILLPQISVKARDILASDGFELLTASCSIRFRGKRLDSHLAIQADPVSLLPEESLGTYAIAHCSVCDDYELAYPRPKHLPPFEIAKKKWPIGQHLVIMLETLTLLCLETFREQVLIRNLRGIEFVEVGQLM